MSCTYCVSRVERAIRKMPGIVEAAVNPNTEKASR
jgi:copper chaperone CopZ